MKKHFISILFLLQHFLIHGQSPENFQLVIEEDTISGMPGLQSFVHAQVDGKWLLIGGRTDGLHPVSYTHLRAHETVLDIVCRLLLEKKKTTSACI